MMDIPYTTVYKPVGLKEQRKTAWKDVKSVRGKGIAECAEMAKSLQVSPQNTHKIHVCS